jgi:hypothetical protein
VSTEGYNRVFLVSNGIRDFLKLDKNHSLKRVNLGIRAFQRCKNKQNGDKIIYRISQEGLHSLFPLIAKRKLKVSMESFMFLTFNQNIKHSSVPEDKPELRAIVNDPEQGYFIMYVEEDGKVIEMCTLLKFTSSIYFMGSEEVIRGLKIKYCDDFKEDVKVITKEGAPKDVDGQDAMDMEE